MVSAPNRDAAQEEGNKPQRLKNLARAFLEGRETPKSVWNKLEPAKGESGDVKANQEDASSKS